MSQHALAIVGMSGRFPGAPTISAFWEMLRDGRDALTHFSEEEVVAAGVAHSRLADPRLVRAGMILDDVESFDADFFGIPAHDAVLMDPQQRLLLECSWEALAQTVHADAARIAIFAGARLSEYALFLAAPPDLLGIREPAVEGFRRMTGNDKDYIATRIAYALDLRGPAVTVQTACSTSLVAMHFAAQSLLSGECDIALAGGASVLVPQRTGYVHAEGMIYSPDGHTRSFDAAGAGTIFGSGAGVVALKRLDDATRDGDVIHAVVLGTAINNDGAGPKNGFTAPSLEGQVRVIAEALGVAGVAPGSVSYVEGHGTATPVGDPIEVAALSAAYRGAASCALGSVKSNVGHLVQAAGVAGVIKTALMLRHRTLVPSVHFREPNPLIDFASSPFAVNTATRPWDANGTPLRAGVSAFGFGGTNAHAVLEEPPRITRAPDDGRAELLTLSAKSPAALRDAAAAVGALLAEGATLRDVAHTTRQQEPMPFRFATSARTASGAIQSLERAAETASRRDPRIGFLFTGQSSQYAGMSRGLYDTHPDFRRVLEACDAILGGTLIETLFGPDAEARLATTRWAQPAIVSMEIALASLWRSWGVTPDAVIGHSVGEVAAACSAGILSLEDAVRLADVRGRLMERCGAGAMAVLMTRAESVGPLLPRGVEVAAVNTTEQTVITGARERVSETVALFAARGVTARMLSGYAFHSALLEPILDELEAAAREMTHLVPATTFISTVTGAALASGNDWPSYWRRQARETVRFADAVASAQCDLLVEIGPDATLAPLARGAGRETFASLRRERDEREQMLATAGALWSRGARLDLHALQRDGSRRVELPPYSFQRKRFWIERAPAPAEASRPDTHPLLGSRVASPLKQAQFRATLTAGAAPFTRDHWIYGMRPLVMVGQIEMIRAAAQGATIENTVVAQPLLLDETARKVQTVVEPLDDGSCDVRIFSSADDATWTLHTTARAHRNPCIAPPRVDLGAVRARCVRQESGDVIRARKRARGAEFGPAFETVQRAWIGAGEVLAEVAITDEELRDVGKYMIHPSLFDAVPHCADLVLGGAFENDSIRFLPTVTERTTFFSPVPSRVLAHIRRRDDASGDVFGIDCTLCRDDGEVLVEVEGMFLKRARPEVLRRGSEAETYEVVWKPVTPGSASDLRGNWLFACDGAETLIEEIQRRGGTCTRIRDLQGALTIVQRAIDEQPASPLKIVTRGGQCAGSETSALVPMQGSLWGFGRVVQNEHPALRGFLIDLDPSGIDDGVSAQLALAGDEREIAVRNGQLLSPRLARVAAASFPPAYRLGFGQARTLESLAVTAASRRAPGPREVEIEICASGLNFRDVLVSTGRVDAPFGLECSGVVARCGEGVDHLAPGDAVLAVAHHSLASHVTIPARHAIRKPSSMTFAAAAGAVVPFFTAWHGLVDRAALQPGDVVLVHTATGGVGQAAMQIARSIGARVIATASSRKRSLALELGAEVVLDSRAPGFAEAVLRHTRGRGVDAVLNTLGNEFLDDNLAVLRRGGTLVELGHHSIIDFGRAESGARERGISFVAFHVIEDLAKNAPERLPEILREIVERMDRGELRPIPHRAFPLARAREAFETMLRGAHVGKLVILHPAAERATLAVRPDATYVVTGGLGAVGRRVTESLIAQGARHVAVLTRRETASPGDGVVRVFRADVGDRASLNAAMTDIEATMPPIRGVVHAAGVLDDALLPRLDAHRLAAVLAPKAGGAANLDAWLGDRIVDFFVLVSSASGLWGNEGQASYAAANAFLDTLAHERRRRGLNAVALDYGLWRGEGMAESLGEAARGRRNERGLQDLDPSRAVEAMWTAAAAGVAQAGVFNVDWSRFGSDRPLLRELAARVTEPVRASATGSPPASAADALLRIRRHASELLSHSLTDTDLSLPLPDLGLDSLTVLLLRGRIAAEFGDAGALPVVRFLEGCPIEKLADLVWSQSRPAPLAPWVALRQGSDECPILLLPPAGSHAARFATIAAAIDTQHPIFGVTTEVAEADPARVRIDEVASRHVAEYLAAYPPGSTCIVGGMCFGAWVAYEMARQLTAKGVRVPLVIAIDTPATFVHGRDAGFAKIVKFYLHRLRVHILHRTAGKAVVNRLRQTVELLTGPLKRPEDDAVVREAVKMHDLTYRAALRYRARRFEGDLLLLQAGNTRFGGFAERWSLVVGGKVETAIIPGGEHFTMLNESLAPAIAGAITGRLRASNGVSAPRPGRASRRS